MKQLVVSRVDGKVRFVANPDEVAEIGRTLVGLVSLDPYVIVRVELVEGDHDELARSRRG